jgi:hypothetical protein
MPMKVFSKANDFLNYEIYDINKNLQKYTNILKQWKDETYGENKSEDPENIDNFVKLNYGYQDYMQRDLKTQNNDLKEHLIYKYVGCTFNISKFSPLEQEMYFCQTCSQQQKNVDESLPSIVICLACKSSCHDGHYLIPFNEVSKEESTTENNDTNVPHLELRPVKRVCYWGMTEYISKNMDPLLKSSFDHWKTNCKIISKEKEEFVRTQNFFQTYQNAFGISQTRMPGQQISQYPRQSGKINLFN